MHNCLDHKVGKTTPNLILNPHKVSDLKVVFLKGWCTNCQNLKSSAIGTSPWIAMEMFQTTREGCGCFWGRFVRERPPGLM